MSLQWQVRVGCHTAVGCSNTLPAHARLHVCCSCRMSLSWCTGSPHCTAACNTCSTHTGSCEGLPSSPHCEGSAIQSNTMHLRSAACLRHYLAQQAPAPLLSTLHCCFGTYIADALALHAFSPQYCPTAGQRCKTHSAHTSHYALLVHVPQTLGIADFFLAGHHRGSRVGHRLALDHEQRVCNPVFLWLCAVSAPACTLHRLKAAPSQRRVF